MDDRMLELIVDVRVMRAGIDNLQSSQAVQMKALDEIKAEVKKTNGRVTELETKSSIDKAFSGLRSKGLWLFVGATLSFLAATAKALLT